jgi:tight adherence protein B
MGSLIIGLAFLAGFLAIFGINTLMADIQTQRRAERRARLEEQQRLQQRERARASVQHADLSALAAESADELGGHKSLTERIGLLLEQSGSQISLAHLAMTSLGLMAGAGVIVYLLAQNVFVSAGAAAVVSVIPLAYVHFLRASRIAKLRSQLADGFDLMARSMRAGQTFSQSLLSVADESSAPLADELRYCYEQQNLGLSAEAAMRELGRRTGLLEIKIFSLAVLIHQQTGGNLSDLLDKLSAVIRDRARIDGMIASLTAEGKLQAIILLALPVALFMYLFVVNRPYAMDLVNSPLLLGGTLVSMTLGALWIRKIINFDH